MQHSPLNPPDISYCPRFDPSNAHFPSFFQFFSYYCNSLFKLHFQSCISWRESLQPYEVIFWAALELIMDSCQNETFSIQSTAHPIWEWIIPFSLIPLVIKHQSSLALWASAGEADARSCSFNYIWTKQFFFVLRNQVHSAVSEFVSP